MTEDLEIHIIELPKIRENLEDGSLKKWILFLENPEGEETKKMAEEEKEIKEAIETLEDISSDEANIRIAELREKYVMDRESELETAEEKGIKEGRKQGEEETLEKIAKNLKNKNVSIDEIMEITGLAREKIKKL